MWNQVLENVVTWMICRCGKIVYLVLNYKSLGNIDLLSDMINFIEIHHILFENLRMKFRLEFIIVRSFRHGFLGYIWHDPIGVTRAVLLSSSMVIFLSQNVWTVTLSGQIKLYVTPWESGFATKYVFKWNLQK